jgi:hypothetical protein
LFSNTSPSILDLIWLELCDRNEENLGRYCVENRREFVWRIDENSCDVDAGILAGIVQEFWPNSCENRARIVQTFSGLRPRFSEER